MLLALSQVYVSRPISARGWEASVGSDVGLSWTPTPSAQAGAGYPGSGYSLRLLTRATPKTNVASFDRSVNDVVAGPMVHVLMTEWTTPCPRFPYELVGRDFDRFAFGRN